MTSNIIEFPSHIIANEVESEPKLCFDCKNCMTGPLGSYCAHWREEIVSETIAEDCDSYERY